MALQNYEWSDIADLMNTQNEAFISEENMVKADLSNIADFGKTVAEHGNLLPTIKSLLVKITKTIVEDKTLGLEFPYLWKTEEEFGGVIEKVNIEMPDSVSPQNHNLVDGQVYVDGEYKAYTVHCNLWELPEASFEFDYSIDDKDIKKAFKDASSFMAFMTARHNAIRKAIIKRKNILSRDALNSMIAKTVATDFASGNYGSGSGNRAVNLFYLYKQSHPDSTITFATRRYDRDYQLFCRREIAAMVARLKVPSVLYNNAGLEQWSTEKIHTILLNDFVMDNEAYRTIDNAITGALALPEYDKVDFWQAPGTNPTYESRSKIHVQLGNTEVELANIVGCMFDPLSVSLHNEGENQRSAYIASGDFTNVFVTVDCKAILDNSEIFVVFFEADEETISA